VNAPVKALTLWLGVLVVACGGQSTPGQSPTGPSVSIDRPDPKVSLPVSQSRFEGQIGAQPVCSYAPTPCQRPGYSVSALLVFTPRGVSEHTVHVRTDSAGAFSLSLPPGEYTMTVHEARGIASGIDPGIAPMCPGPTDVTAPAGVSRFLHITCVFG
jgi:hypothetical protein